MKVTPRAGTTITMTKHNRLTLASQPRELLKMKPSDTTKASALANLKAFRQKHGLTQAQLAELLPVNLRTLQEWELDRGKGKPPPFLWRALAHLESELRQVKPGKNR